MVSLYHYQSNLGKLNLSRFLTQSLPTRPLSWFVNKPLPGSGMTDIQANLIEFFRHSRTSITGKAETRFFFPSHRNCVSTAGWWMRASVTMSDRCRRLAGRLRNARKPRVLTSITWHIRPTANANWCALMDVNRTAFGARRTPW